jgi:hypothetical protein
MQHAESVLTCRDLLERHAEYLDGLVTDREARRFDNHLQSCRNCQRYDRVVRRGLLLARNLPEVEPSEHFHERLQARLMGLDSEPPREPIVANSATLLVIAAVLALIAVTPFLVNLDTGAEPVVVTSSSVPTFVPLGPAELMPTPPSHPTAAVLVRLDQPIYFSPVVISPPAVQTAPSAPRLISYPFVEAATTR